MVSHSGIRRLTVGESVRVCASGAEDKGSSVGEVEVITPQVYRGYKGESSRPDCQNPCDKCPFRRRVRLAIISKAEL